MVKPFLAHKEHPVDHSQKGVIARYSGMSDEQVDETLALIERANFVANYDPSGLLPLKSEQKEQIVNFAKEDAGENTQIAWLWQEVVYADLRNRVKVV